MNMSLFKSFKWSVVYDIVCRHGWFFEFNFSDENYVSLNSSLEGDEGSVAQTIVEGGGVKGVRD